MFRAVGRMLVVSFGFITACVVAAAIAALIAVERLTPAIRDESGLRTVLGWLVYVLNLSFVTTLILALVVVVVGEVARIRSVLYYVIGGGFAVGAAPFLVGLQRSTETGAVDPHIIAWQIFASAGFLGGACYWLIAGRRA